MRNFRGQLALTPWLVVFGCALFGCSSGAQSASGSDPNAGAAGVAAGAGGAAAGGAAGSSGGGAGDAGSVATGGSSGSGGSSAGAAGTVATGTTQCSDGIDNDHDGLIDGMDPECTGPDDNDESSYATGIPGDNRDPKWQDCFFDGNSGAGDDDCRYATGCLTGDLPKSDPDCQLSAACIDFCQPLTPNGCDCFGCCTVALPGGTSVDIALGAGCSLVNAADSQACPRCVKTTECANDCGTCELCPGKTIADLPASCTSTPSDGGAPTGDGGTPPPSYTCDNGETVCGDGLPCSTSEFCSFGCCLAIVP